MKHALGQIEDIPEKGSKLVDFFGRTAYLYRLNGKPRAVMNTCMHFGGPLEYKENDEKFVCSWHGAEYRSDGLCAKGPAPSNSKLMFLSTRIEEDTLYYVWGE